MEPTELRRKREQKSKGTSTVMFLLLLIVVVCLAVFVYLKSQNIDIRKINVSQLLTGELFSQKAGNEEDRPVEIKYDAKDQTAFSAYKDYLVKCTRDGIYGLDKNGDEKWFVSAPMSNPVVKVAGAYMLVADMGGRDIYEFNDKEVKWSNKVESNIINADISEGGYVTIVKEDKRSRGSVVLYNLQGVEVFTKGIGENIVMMAKVSPSNKEVLINSMDISGVKADTNLEFTDMNGKSLAAKALKESIVFPSIWWLGGESALGVCENLIVCFDKVGNEKWRMPVNNGRVLSSTVVQNKYPVVAVSMRDGTGIFGSGASEVWILKSGSNRAEQAASYKLNSEVKNISSYNDIIAVNTGREVHFISTKGKLVGKYTSKTDIMSVSFFNKLEAAVVCKGSVSIIKIAS